MLKKDFECKKRLNPIYSYSTIIAIASQYRNK